MDTRYLMTEWTGRLTGLVAAALVLSLGGCGVSYTSPAVRPGDVDSPVRVVELTPSTATAANRSAYTPRSLPEAFYATAGGGTLVGAGALPAAPYLPEARPRQLDHRPLPDIVAQRYRIGIGDVVLLATRGTASTVEQLSGLLAAQNQRQGYTVRDDGAIAIPEIGTVQLAGMTLQEAEDKLFQALVAHQIDPSFSLEVAEFNSRRVAVGGAVRNAQLVPITLTPLTLGDALAMAGGIAAKDAEFASIRIYRDGNLYEIPLEIYQAQPELQKKLLSDGDAVFVDTSYDLDRAMAFYTQKLDVISLRGLARGNALKALETEIALQRAALDERRANFRAQVELDAQQRDYVYLAGEVTKQSRFALPYGHHATLADVLYAEGGFDTTTGNPAQIYVLRAGETFDGDVTAYHLNTRNAVNIVTATQMQMRPNDVVFIEEQPVTKWNRSLQQFLPVLSSAAKSSL